MRMREWLLPMVALAMISIPMRAQSADGALPTFEVATIKPPDPNGHVMIYPPGMKQETLLPGNGRSFIARAYDMMANSKVRVLGGPAWIDSDRYIIVGKIPDDLFAKMQTMSNPEKEHQVDLMLRSLLSERFKLKVHSETREMPIYELVAAKDGPKMDALKPIDTAGSGMSWGKGDVRVAASLQDAFQMAPFGLEGRPVVNKTGLTGTYRFTLKWNPPPMPGANVAAQPAADSEPEASIFTVIQEQLGLKLVPAKGPVEVIVIDSIERPSDN
jgi:bla regulator protein blaR1